MWIKLHALDRRNDTFSVTYVRGAEIFQVTEITDQNKLDGKLAPDINVQSMVTFFSGSTIMVQELAENITNQVTEIYDKANKNG